MQRVFQIGGPRSGRTRAALLDCPRDAIYLVRTDDQVGYARALAHFLGRDDIKIRSIKRVVMATRGMPNPVRVDHEAELWATSEQLAYVRALWARESGRE